MQRVALGLMLLSALTVILFTVTIAYRWYAIWNELFNHASF